MMVFSLALPVMTGCRTRQHLPAYMPKEVVAKQVGGAVVYEFGYTPGPTATPSAPATSVTAPATAPRVEPAPMTPAMTHDPALQGRSGFARPEGVAVTEGGLRAATVSWTAPLDPIYRYRLERAESPDGPYMPVAEVAPRRLQYTDGGNSGSALKDSATYYYRVVAVIERGGPEGDPSMIVKTTTAPPPTPPGNVQATASGSRAVTIRWQPATSPAVVNYRVERAAGAASAPFAPVGVVQACTYTDGGTPTSDLKDSTAYRYRVVAINRVDSESGASPEVPVVTLPPPKPPRGLTAASEEVRCVPLAWQVSPETDITRYDVYRAREEQGPFTRIASVEPYTRVTYLDGGANPGDLEDEGVYFYRLRAVNAVTAESADSETVRAVTRAVPAEVQGLTLTPNRPREVPVSWAVHADPTVIGYELWRSEADAEDWVPVVRLEGRQTTHYLDRGGAPDKSPLGALKDGTVYAYKVVAFNTARVRSSATLPASARTKYSPATPQGLTATTHAPLAVQLAWSANPEPDIGDYVVESSSEPAGGFRKLVAVPSAGGAALSAREASLAPATVRYYRIKAMDRDGLESAWSPVVEGRSKPLPGCPVNLQTQPVGLNARLTWTAPAAEDVRSYKLWRRKLIGWELVSATERTEYLFEATELAKPIRVAVTAVDRDELESEKSEAVEIRSGL
jgi:fibronectin type 3 domain-containing protein